MNLCITHMFFMNKEKTGNEGSRFFLLRFFVECGIVEGKGVVESEMRKVRWRNFASR